MSDKKRILIADDDTDTRDLFTTVLKEHYEVDIASDGAEALSKLSVGGYDLILLDAMMPKMDGLSVLTRIQTMKTEKSNGPVILNTNLSGDAIVSQALAAGAKACIIKTDINPDQLLEKVNEYIR